MSMPETAMHKNRYAETGQHNIRPTGKISRVQPKPKPGAKKGPSHSQFW